MTIGQKRDDEEQRARRTGTDQSTIQARARLWMASGVPETGRHHGSAALENRPARKWVVVSAGSVTLQCHSCILLAAARHGVTHDILSHTHRCTNAAQTLHTAAKLAQPSPPQAPQRCPPRLSLCDPLPFSLSCTSREAEGRTGCDKASPPHLWMGKNSQGGGGGALTGRIGQRGSRSAELTSAPVSPSDDAGSQPYLSLSWLTVPPPPPPSPPLFFFP